MERTRPLISLKTGSLREKCRAIMHNAAVYIGNLHQLEFDSIYELHNYSSKKKIKNKDWIHFGDVRVEKRNKKEYDSLEVTLIDNDKRSDLTAYANLCTYNSKACLGNVEWEYLKTVDSQTSVQVLLKFFSYCDKNVFYITDFIINNGKNKIENTVISPINEILKKNNITSSKYL